MVQRRQVILAQAFAGVIRAARCGIYCGMTKKIAVSLPEGVWARAKSVVKSGRAASVSGYIASLIEQEAERESFAEMIARWDREDGRSPEEVERGRVAARLDFERAGLVAPSARTNKKRRARG